MQQVNMCVARCVCDLCCAWFGVAGAECVAWRRGDEDGLGVWGSGRWIGKERWVSDMVVDDGTWTQKHERLAHGPKTQAQRVVHG